MTTNPTKASILWPSTLPASTILFVTRQWPKPHAWENGQAPPKQENVPVRKVKITTHSAMGGPTSASNPTMATIGLSPEKRGKKCKPSYIIYAQLATCPFPLNPNWSEENKYYYPPEPKYVLSSEETIPILVTGENNSEQEKRKEKEESIENRRIVVGIGHHLPRLCVDEPMYKLQ